MKPFVNLALLVLSLHLFQMTPGLKSGVGVVLWQIPVEAKRNPSTLADRQSALKQLEESVRVSLSEGQVLQAARNLTRMGDLQRLLNDPQASRASHLQALDLLRQSPDPQVEVDNLNGSAAAYLSLQQKDLAQAALEKAQSLSKQAQYPLGEAQSLLTLSDLQNSVHHATAVVTAQAALALWQSAGDKEGLARTYTQLGTCYMAQNLLSEATQNFAQALELWRALGHGAQEAEALIMLGFVEFRKGEWQASVDYYTQAYGLVDETAEPGMMGKIAAGLGATFNENGLPEMGVAQYKRALDLYRKTGQMEAINYATAGLGKSYYLSGDLAQASSYLQQALDAIDKDLVPAALIREFLGKVYIARSEYALAMENLQPALAAYEKAGNPKEAARVRALMGQVYDRQGQVGRARTYYSDALEDFTRLEDRVNQSAVLYALGQFEFKQRNYEQASSYLQQSIDVTENMRRVSTVSELTTAFSATVQGRYEAFVECLMKLHERQPTREFAVKAFETSELSRARVLSELLLAMQTSLVPGIDPKLALREKSLRQTLRIKENDKIKLLGANDREELKALEAETARLESEYKEVSETIRSRYSSYGEISKPTAWDLQHIQTSILPDDDAVLLEYSLGDENSYAWTVTRQGFESYRLASKKEIEDAVRRVYALLAKSDAAETELAQATAQLSELVLTPVAASLNKHRIIVVADGALNYIPFQALHAPAKDGDPLVTNYEVINVPSASILGQLRLEKSRRPSPAKLLAAFGDPVFPSDYAQRAGSNPSVLLAADKPEPGAPWESNARDVEIAGDSFDPSTVQRLLYTKLELANLQEIAGSKSLVVTGFDASRQTLEHTDLSKFAILHLATHGFLDPRRPEHSGFVLSMVDPEGHAQNGFMTMQDVYRLHAPLDLVVLSSCRSGLGKDVRGEGLIGLTRGFMYAGASSVVASLWRVDDEATSELMKHFYANMLQKNMTPSAALREAQNALRKDPHWQSPHYWAGFTLQGEFKEPIRAAATSGASTTVQTIVGAGLMAALLAGIAWGYWRRRGVRLPIR
jgi:CHAT domain-containing protein